MQLDVPVALAEPLASAVGLVFLFAVISKLRNLRGFVQGIRSFNMLPSRLVSTVALVVLFAEFAIAVSHLTRLGFSTGVPLALTLLCAFLGITLFFVLNGERRACICFGANADKMLDGTTVVRIGMMTVAELVLLAYVLGNDVAWGATSKATQSLAESILPGVLILALVNLLFAGPDVRLVLFHVRRMRRRHQEL